ncbi:MAG: outer membrane beta-barrel protein [Gemmatimonadota bacterium]
MLSPNSMRSLTALATLTAASALLNDLSAQNSTTRGFNFGFALEGAGLTVEGGDQANGGGAGLRIGYGMNRIVTFFVGADGTAFNVEDPDAPNGDWTMAHVDLGARFHFANALRSWVPYLEGAFTARAVRLNDAMIGGNNVGDLSFNGGAFTVGGGLSVYFSQTFALDLELMGSGGDFTSITVDAGTINIPDIQATSGRFRIGLLWWK